METTLIDNRTSEVVAADDAWERHQRIVGLRRQATEDLLHLSEELYWFKCKEQYKAVGCVSFNAYLASPEVHIPHAVGHRLVRVYEVFVLGLNCTPGVLLEAGTKRLDVIAPYVTEENKDDLLIEASVLSESDLRQRMKELFPPIMPAIPKGKYRIIYADPPWKYGNTMPDYFTEQGDYYPLMEIAEICALQVKELAADNAVLFLWATSPILEEAFEVIKAWGFEYKTSFVWDKVKHCMGHYNSVRHEFLLVCVRGSCQPDERTLFDSVVTEERIGRHSEKPEVFRGFIDALYTWGPRIELFARQEVKEWDVWGNEVP
jgi:N6-adenosine-specific RNA methylase IME4